MTQVGHKGIRRKQIVQRRLSQDSRVEKRKGISAGKVKAYVNRRWETAIRSVRDALKPVTVLRSISEKLFGHAQMINLPEV